MSKNAKKIGFFDHQRSGCFWYRIKHPMDTLNAHGYQTEVIRMDKDIEIDNFQSVLFYGAYPYSMEKILKLFKEKGIKIIYDTDDALDLIDISNPFYYSVKRDVGSVKQILEYADEITVSTPIMKEYMAKMTDKKITVVPNCYLSSEWTANRVEKSELRIGFSGASPHVSDLVEIIPIIKRLQDKYKFKFYISGFGQTSYAEWYKQYRYIAQPEAIEELVKLDKALSKMSFEWVPFVDFTIFPYTLTNLSLDIGICPLKDTPFNRHRSAVKALEYTFAGALAISSDILPYQNEPTSIRVKPEEWETTLEKYILDIELRNETREKHLEWIKNNRNMESHVDLLKSIYVVE